MKEKMKTKDSENEAEKARQGEDAMYYGDGNTRVTSGCACKLRCITV